MTEPKCDSVTFTCAPRQKPPLGTDLVEIYDVKRLWFAMWTSVRVKGKDSCFFRHHVCNGASKLSIIQYHMTCTDNQNNAIKIRLFQIITTIMIIKKCLLFLFLLSKLNWTLLIFGLYSVLACIVKLFVWRVLSFF